MKRSKRSMFTFVELTVIVGVVVLMGIVIFAICSLPAAREKSRRVNCSENLRQFGQAFANYTAAGENFRPIASEGGRVLFGEGTKALELLITSGELTDFSNYVCPSSETKQAQGGSSLYGHVSYAYIPGLDSATGADSGIMADGHTDPENPNHKMYGNILFGDGHVAGSTGTSAKNWIQNANWVSRTYRDHWTYFEIDESWLETRTDKRFQIGPRIK